MFKTLKNAWKIPELKSRLIFTLLIVVLYRLGANIPVPYVSADALTYFDANASGIFEYLNILSGSAFGQATLFALSVSPYITASIVMQLLTIAIPALERLSKDGEEGKKKINAITRYVTVALSLVTAIGYALILEQYGMLSFDAATDSAAFFKYAVMVACYCAGAAIIMWMAEKINEHGIGNGISMILFANIISRVPDIALSLWNMTFTAEGFSIWGLLAAIG